MKDADRPPLFVSSTRPDYLVIGHVTRDRLPSGAVVAGGTARYAARTALRLGLRPAILTAAASDEPSLADIPLARCPSPATSTFAHHYADGRRSQFVEAVAAPIDLAYLPSGWRSAPIVHIGPVLGECDPRFIVAFPRALLGVTAQGFLRRVDAPLPAPMEPTTWQPSAALLARADLLVLSIEDVAGDERIAATYANHCRRVALTRGHDGLTLWLEGTRHELPATPAHEVDANGAGDVFAAAMLVRLAATDDALAAARFATRIAARAVERKFDV